VHSVAFRFSVASWAATVGRFQVVITNAPSLRPRRSSRDHHGSGSRRSSVDDRDRSPHDRSRDRSRDHGDHRTRDRDRHEERDRADDALDPAEQEEQRRLTVLEEERGKRKRDEDAKRRADEQTAQRKLRDLENVQRCVGYAGGDGRHVTVCVGLSRGLGLRVQVKGKKAPLTWIMLCPPC